MSIIEEGKYNRILIEKFKTDYLPQKYYFRHSDIDIYVNIVITQLLNYNLLLSDEMKNFLRENARRFDYIKKDPRNSGLKRVRPIRFERITFGSVDRCSIQLSYGRV